MAHTFTSLHYHCTFAAAGRRNLIPQDMMSDIHAYMGGIARNLHGTAIAIGGTANHAHVLVGLPASVRIATAVGKIKANSTGWIHSTFPTMSDFSWQTGYGAFTVSRSQIDAVASYIANQAVHHKTQTFEEEFLLLLKKHGIEYDERYLWD